MFSLGYCPFILLLLCNACLNSHAKHDNGSCVATFLEEAGISSAKAAEYEAKYAQQGLQADSIASKRRALVPVIGVSNPSDIVTLLQCFSVQNTPCAAYRFCSGKGQCLLEPSTAPSYECSCQAGYYGDECQSDVCLEVGSKSTCQNGGTCIRISAAPFYLCQCPANYVGERCETAKDHCRHHNRILEEFGTLRRAIWLRMDTLERRLLSQGEKTLGGTAVTQEHTSVTTTLSSPAASTTSVMTSTPSVMTSTTSVMAEVTPTKLRFVEQPGNWYTAKETCASLGGVLAVPRNASEQDILLRLVNHIQRERYIWLGASDSEAEGIWRRVSDNARLNYTAWQSSQPNNYNDIEHCLAHGTPRKGDGDGGWYDRPCTESSSGYFGYVGFLCRLP